jgi:hypothetical protein
MQHFNIFIQGAGAEFDGVYRDVPASAASVALKRVMDGGFQAGYKFATVGKSRVEMAKGDKVVVEIRRWK